MKQELFNTLSYVDEFGDGKISASEIKTMVEIGVLFGTVVVSSFMTWFVAKVLKKRKEKNKLNKETMDYTESNTRIQERIMYLRIKSGASRVRLCMFHNGGEFYSGISMSKFSCTHESSAKGVSNEIENLQNYLTSMFSDKIARIKKNDPEIHSVSHMEEGKSKFLYKNNEVSFFSILPVYKNDMPVGFLEVEWNEDPIPSLVLDFVSLFTLVRSQIEFEILRREN
jgi:hypothetical protein